MLVGHVSNGSNHLRMDILRIRQGLGNNVRTLHSSYKRTSSVDSAKLRLRTNISSSTIYRRSSLPVEAGTETTYSSPLPSARTAMGIGNSAEYNSYKWSVEDSPLLKGLQLLMIFWAPFGPRAKTSSLGRAGAHGGIYEFKSSRSGSSGLLRSARVYRGLSGWLEASSREWITKIAAGVGEASLDWWSFPELASHSNPSQANLK